MVEFFRRLLSTDFMPHVFCLREPGIVALNASSDGLIAVSYFVIPLALIRLVRGRRELSFRWAYILFGLFILACGITHLLDIVTLWWPVYRLDGVVKAITAFASLGTAIMLVRLVPAAIAIPGPAVLKREISERRRAEEQVQTLNAELDSRVRERTSDLEKANAKLAELASALDKAPAIVQRLDGTIVFWNSCAESLYGWTSDQAIGHKSHELLKTELPQPLEKIQSELLERGTWTGEFRQRRRDGSFIWVASYWALHCDMDGVPVSVVKINNDITALKQATEALRTSEATARSLFENASQGILTADRAGRIVDANPMVQRLFAYSRSELIGASVDVLLPEGFRATHAGHRASYVRDPRTRLMGQGLDLVARRKDGSEFPVEISLSYVAAHAEGGLAMAFVSDITARKEAERERERLIASLERAVGEKTVLLKEVHHRVKNNLAVIAGLLAMQADALDDERATVALGESQQRVLSMALIHEYLYATEHLNRVNFGKYVEQLSNELCMSYAIEPNRIHVVVEAEAIDLPVHRAIPCGLILNELVCNAMKYAFPNGRSGEIKVGFALLESSEFVLSCEDSGIGIPESFDWQNAKSLGLRIVRILAKQIDGALTLDRAGGLTRFELRFPKH